MRGHLRRRDARRAGQEAGPLQAQEAQDGAHGRGLRPLTPAHLAAPLPQRAQVHRPRLQLRRLGPVYFTDDTCVPLKKVKRFVIIIVHGFEERGDATKALLRDNHHLGK